MFLEELTPFLKELTQQPIAFMGGFFSGVFRLKPSEDPLKSWLEKQGVAIDPNPNPNNGYNDKPQSISIE